MKRFWFILSYCSSLVSSSCHVSYIVKCLLFLELNDKWWMLKWLSFKDFLKKRTYRTMFFRFGNSGTIFLCAHSREAWVPIIERWDWFKMTRHTAQKTYTWNSLGGIAGLTSIKKCLIKISEAKLAHNYQKPVVNVIKKRQRQPTCEEYSSYCVITHAHVYNIGHMLNRAQSMRKKY